MSRIAFPFARVWGQAAVESKSNEIPSVRSCARASIQTGKGLCGLDEHQVRARTSWRRRTILAMLAHAFLVITVAAERSESTENDKQLVPLTCNEIQHLINIFGRLRINHRHCLYWST